MLRTLLLLTACAFGQGASVRKIVLPSGESGYSVRCDNQNMNACYEAAGDICHLGYDIQTENREGGFESAGSAYSGPGIAPGTSLGIASSSTKSTSEKGLLIQCKDPIKTEFERAVRIRKDSERKSELRVQQREYEKEQVKTAFVGVLLVAAAVATLGFIVASSQ